ncbi:(4Fe-4S)-binding protein [Streptomyces iconiensis]|uniref:(4Fe-4S)-binding protein n=1 Tax=Streptomyces iconiensis TaxID=1384038 RepID=A0ABT6ZUP0_9ACTN|nr:(4Fe-4S)-binding protein [Streptomyces iconiensis]MDJ1132772.1 (4Fe-4S)-binding protein [Streptomyces iconiensis]
MPEDRTRRAGRKRYEGPGIAVSYEVARCLHAAECVRGLPEVFDVSRRPWIDPAAAAPDRIAEVVERCPSGALQYHREDGAPDEVPPAPTRANLHGDGVLHLRGDLRVATPEGERAETRVMLCGCSHTRHAPFCDHTGRCKEHG